MIRSIQILRGLAALAVVAFHVHLTEAKEIPVHVTPEFFMLGDAGVDVFFVISGFIMVFIQPPPTVQRPYSQTSFLISRFTRIFPPYWLAMLPLIPLWLKWPKLFNNHCDNHVEIFRSIWLLPQDYTPLLGVGWTLIHETYFYIVVSFALFFAFRTRLVIGGLWFAMALLVFCVFNDTHFAGNRFLQLCFSPFSLTFLLGYFIGLGRSWISNLSWPLGLFCLFAGLAGLFVNHHSIPDWGVYPDNNYLSRFFAFGLPCGLIVASALMLEAHLPKIILRLQYLGDISYALYLLHTMIITALYLGVSKLPWHGWLPSLVTAITCFFSCLLAAAVFHEKLEVKTSRWLRAFLENLVVKHQKKLFVPFWHRSNRGTD